MMKKFNFARVNSMVKSVLFMFLVFVMGACDAPQSVEKHDAPQTANNDVINDAVIDEYWSYQIAYDNRDNEKYHSFYGLFVMYNCVKIENGERKHYEEVVKFDDEMDYNPYIAEWTMALCVAEKLFKDNQYYVKDSHGKPVYDKYGNNVYRFKREMKEVEGWLTGVRDLPEVDGNLDPEIQEIFRKVYYNNRNGVIYLPKEGYGYRRYPIEGYTYEGGHTYDGYGNKCNEVCLKRTKSDNGELRITWNYIEF